MSKELEALERIKKLLEDKYGLLNYADDLDTIKYALIRGAVLMEAHPLNVRNNRILEIIVTKRLNLDEIYHKDYDWYVSDHKDDDENLIPTQEEYEAVREAME